MTLLMGVLPKGEAGLPTLSISYLLHHYFAKSAFISGRRCNSVLASGLTYVDYPQAGMTLIR